MKEMVWIKVEPALCFPTNRKFAAQLNFAMYWAVSDKLCVTLAISEKGKQFNPELNIFPPEKSKTMNFLTQSRI